MTNCSFSLWKIRPRSILCSNRAEFLEFQTTKAIKKINNELKTNLGFRKFTEAHLGTCQRSVVEPFCENTYYLKAIN